mmetsp:Transcript_40712/g.107851  ORF Transcript_40712/g.107851 Transcript_40712/m.107851 type:complete len:177 (-) Transcript_40712:120-650(-)
MLEETRGIERILACASITLSEGNGRKLMRHDSADHPFVGTTNEWVFAWLTIRELFTMARVTVLENVGSAVWWSWATWSHMWVCWLLVLTDLYFTRSITFCGVLDLRAGFIFRPFGRRGLFLSQLVRVTLSHRLVASCQARHATECHFFWFCDCPASLYMISGERAPLHGTCSPPAV